MKIQSAKAGIGTGRAGLQAASGLFSSAGLFDKGVKSFNPLDLNPYLLFDAQTSMIGTLENPTLDLDPSKQDTLDVITATRAGVATYTDANGNIASASPNTVRVDYVDGVPMILVEPSATNLINYSEDFSQWTGENATIQSDVIISPSGSQDGSKMVASNSVQRQGINKAQTQSGDLAFSVFAKKGEYDVIQITDAVNASSYANFNLTSGTVGSYAVYTPKIEPVGNDWFRCSVTFNSAAINKVRLTIAEQDNDGRLETFAGNGADGLYIWGAQLEAGSLTSYIPTSGSAVTRAKDDLVISGSDFTDFYNQSEGTFYVESITNRADGQPFILSADNSADSSENNTIVVYYSDTTTTTGFIKTSGSIQAILAIGSRPSAGALSRTSLSYKTNDIEGSVDGGSVASDTSATIPTTINRLSIGTRLTLEDDYKITGHVKRLIFWPYHSDSL